MSLLLLIDEAVVPVTTGRINLTSIATFTDDPSSLLLRYAVEFEPTLDQTYIKNYIEVNTPDGTRGRTGSGIATDATSTTDYGTIVETVESASSDGGVRQALAEYTLYLYKQPQERLPELHVLGAVNPAASWPAILGLEIGSAITVKYRDGLADAKTLELVVEGFTLSGNPQIPLDVRIRTSPRDTRSYWTVEHVTRGVIDGSNVVAP